MDHRWKTLGLGLFLAAIFFGMVSAPANAVSRSIVVDARSLSGSAKPLRLYTGYHALVVGCSDYRAGWPKLPNPVRDAREVAAMLRKMDWDVELLEDPGWDRLDHSLNRLITGPGREKNKAVLFWFSGHGYTLEEADGTKLGYIVPVDAPLPASDEIGFMRRAIDMRQIETIVKRIRSKHVLMVFDSCFSGAIFSMVRAAPSDYIEEKIAAPVRQFIAAGREDETVPDRSVFKVCFIQGIADGYADVNHDGYVTGEELGAYLQERVINYSRKAQHPQFGKINNPKLDKGDFVFVLTRSKQAFPSISSTSGPSVKKTAEKGSESKAPAARPAGGTAQPLAYIPKQATVPPISLRKKRETLSGTDIEKMLRKHHFFDSERNWEGQFANYFTDNGDQTISDKATGLQWQKGGSARKLPWRSVRNYLKKLNQQKFAGYSNWRLPTIEELASLSANKRIRGLHIDSRFDSRQNKCWSVDPQSSGSELYSSGWIIDFTKGRVTDAKWPRSIGATGWVEWYIKDNDNYVRAVRSLP